MSVNPDTRLERLYRIERLAAELANVAASMREERLDRDHRLSVKDVTTLMLLSFGVGDAIATTRDAEATE